MTTIASWRPISEDPRYMVSNDGRVMSVASGRILRSKRAGKGYRQVNLGRGVYRYIHRLVAYEFCAIQFDSTQVNHIDGDKANNAASNLEWTTAKGNARHAFNTGLLDGTVCKNQPAIHARARPVVQLSGGDVVAVHKSLRSACTATSTDLSTLVGALQGKFKQAGGFTWRYAQ